MKIKMVGLGKMGLNLALNMMEHHVDVVGFDVNEDVRNKAQAHGIHVYPKITQLITHHEQNIVWVMLPAGHITQMVLQELSEIAQNGDIIIDGGNSDYRDSIKAGQQFQEKGISFIDIGTSGGVSGARHGASFMCGGDRNAYQMVEKLLQDMATTDGCIYTGQVGSGHYLKMVHNAMLYGMMQTLGEGFELLHASSFHYDLEQVAASLSKSSVIRGWLLELVVHAFHKSPVLEDIRGEVSASKTTNWTIESACELGVPIPVISLSLMMRLRSKQCDSFSAKLIASLRDEVGGHKASLK